MQDSQKCISDAGGKNQGLFLGHAPTEAIEIPARSKVQLLRPFFPPEASASWLLERHRRLPGRLGPQVQGWGPERGPRLAGDPSTVNLDPICKVNSPTAQQPSAQQKQQPNKTTNSPTPCSSTAHEPSSPTSRGGCCLWIYGTSFLNLERPAVANSLPHPSGLQWASCLEGTGNCIFNRTPRKMPTNERLAKYLAHVSRPKSRCP